jgi:hypothetical protein
MLVFVVFQMCKFLTFKMDVNNKKTSSSAKTKESIQDAKESKEVLMFISSSFNTQA